MRTVSVAATAVIILLVGSGCCMTVKMYDAKKIDAEVAKITATDTRIRYIDGEKVPPGLKCMKYSVLPGKHVVAARLDKTEYGYGTRRYYLKVSRNFVFNL